MFFKFYIFLFFFLFLIYVYFNLSRKKDPIDYDRLTRILTSNMRGVDNFISSGNSVSLRTYLDSYRDSYHKPNLMSLRSNSTVVSLITVIKKRKNLTVPDVIRRNNESKGEFICREILSKIFKCEFISCRPKFLKSPKTGRNLELDGYNEKLKIAYEYNGIQHYKYPNVFHKSEDVFIKQLERDKWKFQKCGDEDIYLITIPYTKKTYEEIETFILENLPECI